MTVAAEESLADKIATGATKKHTKARVGVFNVGFHRYWPQFPGLKEELDGYRVEFENQLSALGVDVVSGGLADDVDSGRKCGDYLATQNVDLIFCFVTTYVQSAFVVPVAQRAKAHMVLVGLQPTALLLELLDRDRHGGSPLRSAGADRCSCRRRRRRSCP